MQHLSHRVNGAGGRPVVRVRVRVRARVRVRIRARARVRVADRFPELYVSNASSIFVENLSILRLRSSPRLRFPWPLNFFSFTYCKFSSDRRKEQCLTDSNKFISGAFLTRSTWLGLELALVRVKFRIGVQHLLRKDLSV